MDKVRFHKLCEDNKISIAELERTLDMSNGSLRKDGEIKSDRLYALSKYFGVSMEYLMGVDTPMREVPQYNPAIQEFIDILPSLTKEQIDSLLCTARLFVSMNA